MKVTDLPQDIFQNHMGNRRGLYAERLAVKFFGGYKKVTQPGDDGIDLKLGNLNIEVKSAMTKNNIGIRIDTPKNNKAALFVVVYSAKYNEILYFFVPPMSFRHKFHLGQYGHNWEKYIVKTIDDIENLEGLKGR